MVLVSSSGETPTALHHAGVREVYVHLGQQQKQVQQQQQELEQLLPGLLLLQRVPQVTAAEGFSLACIASCSPQGLQHNLILSY